MKPIPVALAAADSPIVLESAAQVARAAKAWRRSSVLGLDTEFVRERTYFANLGLVQVSDGQTVWLVDPLVDGSLEPLAELLSDQAITKIFHSPSEDLEVLLHTTGALPEPMVDTQLACAMLGQALQMGYHAAAEWLLDVPVDKELTRSNWMHRPLRPELLRYAALDVCLLPMMWNMLHQQMAAVSRDEWFGEDCRRMVHTARQPNLPSDSYLRIKGRGKLNGEAMAILQSLASWREKEARKRNRPRGFIAPDRVLLEIADGHLSQVQDYESLSDFHPRARQRYGKAIAGIVTHARQSGKTLPTVPQLSQPQRKELKRLRSGTEKLAQSMGLEPALIASRRDLEQVVLGERPARLEGWRDGVLNPLLS